jgi:EmrB/QacA subfamily drug resistance transporter
MRGPCDEALIASASGAECEASRARWVLAATILGSSMAFLDSSVVTVALPILQKDLGASVSDAQWVVEAYSLFLAALVLAGGALGDRVGRRRVFQIGVLVFGGASAACGLSPGIGALIAARAVQGAGAALLVPTSLAILGAAFRLRDRGRAVGTWSSLTAGVTMVGPALGGWIVQFISWRAVFFLNLPIAAAVLWIAGRKVPESRPASSQPIDVAGAIGVTAGLGALVFGLIEAGARGENPSSAWAFAAGGMAFLGGFVLHERRTPHPMVRLGLFQNLSFRGANLVTLFIYGGVSAGLFLVPFDLIQGRGYTPAQAGVAFLPFMAIVFLLSRRAGTLSDRYGVRLPLTLGPAVAGVAFFVLGALPPEGRHEAGILSLIALFGLGMAITVTPLTAAILDSVDSESTGAASGINNAVARVGGLLAIASLGLLAPHGLDRAAVRLGLKAAAGLALLASAFAAALMAPARTVR